jgi:hypothetical protein
VPSTSIMRRAPESGHKRENSRRGHHVRQRLSAQLSEAGMDVEIEKLQRRRRRRSRDER